MKIADVIPLENRVIVVPIGGPEKSEGGIIMPDAVKDKTTIGKVVAVGRGKRLDDGTILGTIVRSGDTVVYHEYGGKDVECSDGNCKILEEEDIMARIAVPCEKTYVNELETTAPQPHPDGGA